MSGFFDNYRKAAKGEITCEECKHSFIRSVSGTLACALAGDYRVGKKSTCGDAQFGGKGIISEKEFKREMYGTFVPDEEGK